MNGNEYSGLKAELVRIAEEMKGLKDLLTVKFTPIDKHMDESPKFRDKVIKNCASIFWLRVVMIGILIPLVLGVLYRFMFK